MVLSIDEFSEKFSSKKKVVSDEKNTETLILKKDPFESFALKKKQDKKNENVQSKVSPISDSVVLDGEKVEAFKQLGHKEKVKQLKKDVQSVQEKLGIEGEEVLPLKERMKVLKKKLHSVEEKIEELRS
ncbi:MAG: hypothetical protein H6500_00265 [Candidatus Woesearchaeota archaeon]|nr:hypothetical protein [Nanoarchaeota archaeon]USN44268.1 MAG: hypothetical protein H6500_00265 [Candidatus Woesearchaeota archaeon]